MRQRRKNPWRNCHQATELTELVTMRQVCPYPKNESADQRSANGVKECPGRYFIDPDCRRSLTETHAILQRMRELAVQAANDTNVTKDRSAIQLELNELAAEITRIGELRSSTLRNCWMEPLVEEYCRLVPIKVKLFLLK